MQVLVMAHDKYFLSVAAPMSQRQDHEHRRQSSKCARCFVLGTRKNGVRWAMKAREWWQINPACTGLPQAPNVASGQTSVWTLL